MKLDKKIWVKKTYAVNGNRYTQIYSRDFYPTKKSRRYSVNDNEQDLPHYIKAPFWYSGYRYIKANFVKGLIWLMIFITSTAIIIIIKKNISEIKGFGRQIIEKINNR